MLVTAPEGNRLFMRIHVIVASGVQAMFSTGVGALRGAVWYAACAAIMDAPMRRRTYQLVLSLKDVSRMSTANEYFNRLYGRPSCVGQIYVLPVFMFIVFGEFGVGDSNDKEAQYCARL